MRMYDLIEKKKRGQHLSEDEIRYIISGYLEDTIPDYQMAAFLMAVYFQGMSKEEIFALTDVMVKSGDVISLDHISGIKVDKHSTGGVGDKTSIVLLPLMAASGMKASKMSGRGLGHTGGTIDKLESIPGFNTSLTNKEMTTFVNSIGFAINGQTPNLVPADKKLYALRDVTATVDHLALIASSIMSKKLASGADYILLDVKIGSGAFVKNIEEGIELSKIMIDIGDSFNKQVATVLSNMDEPLGEAVGNSLEIIESVETLKGKGPKSLTNLCLVLNGVLMYLTGLQNTIEEGVIASKRILRSGAPWEKFVQFVKAQNGDVKAITYTSLLDKASKVIPVTSESAGYVGSINAEAIGKAALLAGAGRETKEDKIDPSAGIICKKHVGDSVKEGELVAIIHTNKEETKAIEDLVLSAYHIQSNQASKIPSVFGVVTKEGYIPIEGLEN